jgi:hypothetical protein
MTAIRTVALVSKTAPAVAVAVSLSNEGGVPTQRFRKELIRVGHYVKASDGLEFDVTQETLDHWVLSFGRMQAAGVKVPIPVGHTQDVTANRGWLVGLERQGDSLYGIAELVGTDALALAACSDVSIFVPAVHVDGHGNQYLRPITHVALVTDPVVPGLAGFQAIAASLASGLELTVLNRKDAIAMADALPVPAAPAASDASTGSDTTSTILASLKTQIGKAFVDLDWAGFQAKARDLFKVKDTITKLLGDDDPANDQEAVDAAAAVAASLATAVPSVAVSLSQTPDPMMVSLLADNRRMKLAARVAAGKLTPAQADLLTKQYIGDGGAAISLSMSKGVDDGFDALLGVFDQAVGTTLGERTGGQTIGLSLGNPNNGGKNPLVANAEARAAKAKADAQR